MYTINLDQVKCKLNLPCQFHFTILHMQHDITRNYCWCMLTLLNTENMYMYITRAFQVKKEYIYNEKKPTYYK